MIETTATTDAPAVDPAPGATTSPGEAVPAASPGLAPGAVPAPTLGAMPEGLDPTFWHPQSGQVDFDRLTKSFNDLKTFKDEADQRVASVPAEYKLDLPEDVAVPEGMEVTFDPKSEEMKEAAALAKEVGLDQATFSKFLALDAKRIIREQEDSSAEIAEEMAKLGENGPARTQAAEAFLKASGLNEDEYDAVAAVIYSADAVSGLEKIMKRVVSSGMPSNPPLNGASAPEAAKPKLTSAELFYPSNR